MLQAFSGAAETGSATSISTPFFWLASYPRSGNTMLRTILSNCFGLKSASVYPRDLGGQADLERKVGHIERSADGAINFGDQPIHLLKTHGRPDDAKPAIYVIRNGREAILSYYRFRRGTLSIADIIFGREGMLSWSAHLDAWRPLERPDTLLLRYEDMVSDLEGTVQAIARFSGAPIRSFDMPDRESLADNKWIVSASAKRPQFAPDTEAVFQELHGATMMKYGYR